jgi:HK97 family phage prohead protease
VDFKVYTNALKAYEAPDGELYVTGTTSSTIRDLHGDEMTLNAIRTMADTAKQNMTIFLNHNYNVPEDLFGSVTDARVVKRFDVETNQEVYDLDIDVLVCKEDENPEAMRAYKAIKRGVKLGLSIGARVDRVSKKKDNKTGEDTYVIDSVKLMEASVVGIPANQRSYLQNAVKSLKAAEKAGELTLEEKAATDPRTESMLVPSLQRTRERSLREDE